MRVRPQQLITYRTVIIGYLLQLISVPVGIVTNGRTTSATAVKPKNRGEQQPTIPFTYVPTYIELCVRV